MRARDLRDVIDVLVLPSLERALDELSLGGGSKARARILVEHAATQLRGIVVQPEADRFNRMRAAEKEAASTISDSVDGVAEDTGAPRAGEVEVVTTEEDRNGHDFSFEFKLGNHLCRCGAAENGSDATRWCPLKERPSHSGVPASDSPTVDLHGHDFSYFAAPVGGRGTCRCGAVEGSEAAKQGCGLPASVNGGA